MYKSVGGHGLNLIFLKYPMKMKQFGLIHFHRIFKNGGRGWGFKLTHSGSANVYLPQNIRFTRDNVLFIGRLSTPTIRRSLYHCAPHNVNDRYHN